MDSKRMIDANELMKNIGKIPQLRGITYGRMKKAVEDTPTIDANEALNKARHEIEKLKKTIDQLKEIARGDCQWCKHDNNGQVSETCERCVHYSWENTPDDNWEFELEEEQSCNTKSR